MVLIIRKYSLLILSLSLVFCFLVYNTYSRPKVVDVFGLPITSKVIVIDAGHGGVDPGKVGSKDKKLEKDINLDIAIKLQNLLEQAGAVVIMTRTKDEGLYPDEGSLRSKKNADLRARRILTNESNGDLLISIHQNSYPDPSCKGAQVFYYGNSAESKLLAKSIQEAMVKYIDPQNHRKYKSNESYAMLKNTKIPSVIIECGFMSHPEEERKLNDPRYQSMLAEAIYSGVKTYFENLKKIEKGESTFEFFLGKEAYFSSSDEH